MKPDFGIPETDLQFVSKELNTLLGDEFIVYRHWFDPRWTTEFRSIDRRTDRFDKKYNN